MVASYVVVGVLLVAVIVAALLRARKPEAVREMQAEDGADPLKRWARGCYSLLYGQTDPARRGFEFCRSSLEKAWSVRSPDEVRALLGRLSAIPSGRIAWDVIRYVTVARLAAGAAFLPDAECWAAIGGVQARMQASYPSWDAAAADYDAVRAEKGFDAGYHSLRPHAEAIWALVAFK